MKWARLGLGLSALAPGVCLALNTTPESNGAIGWWPAANPIGCTSSSAYSQWDTTYEGEGYEFVPAIDASFYVMPGCRLQNLYQLVRNQGYAASLYIQTYDILYGDVHGPAMTCYQYSELGLHQANLDAADLIGSHGFSDEDFDIFAVNMYCDNAYVLVLYPSGIERIGDLHPAFATSMVFNNSTYSEDYVASWNSRCVLTLNNVDIRDSTLVRYADTVHRRLRGVGGVSSRPAVAASQELSDLICHGNGDWVLAPTVVLFEPECDYWGYFPGFYDVRVEFDAFMDRDGAYALQVRNGYASNGTPGTGSAPHWVDDHTLAGSVVSLTCPGPIEAFVDARVARSLLGGHHLNGGGACSSVGVAPNGDDFDFVFGTHASEASCDNFATQYSSWGAFPVGTGQTSVYWQVEFQKGIISYTILGGAAAPTDVVATVLPKPVTGKRPVGYAITVRGDPTVFQIVGRDSTDVETRSRPFHVGERPTDFDDLVHVDEMYPDIQIEAYDPARRITSSAADKAERTDPPHYLFVSSRQDFLSACAPVITRLAELGHSSSTVLTTSDPWDIQSHLVEYWRSWEDNPLGFKPRVLFIGDSDEAGGPENIVGTFYSPDTTNICWVSSWCVRDPWLVDFDGDHVEDLPWTRVPASTLPQLQNAVESYRSYLSNQDVSPRRALILNGDLDGDCAALEEPTATIQRIAALYNAHGTPVVRLDDSAYEPCDDWAGRQSAARDEIQAGVTEITGAGYASQRRASPGWFIQDQLSPYWDMSLVPRRQRVIGLFPACDFSDVDRYNPSRMEIGKMWVTAPPSGTSAVFWGSHGRGAWGRAQLFFFETLMTRRLTTGFADLAMLYHLTARDLAETNRGLVDYLGSVQLLGWPVWAPYEQTTSVGAAGRAPELRLVGGNPVRLDGTARFEFAVAARGRMRFDVIDAAGRLVDTSTKMVDAGAQTFEWSPDAQDRRIPSGVYFVRLRTTDGQRSAKLVLLQ
jgi:hypothetical protein